MLTFRRLSYLRVCSGDLEGLHFLVFTILKHERTVSGSIHEPPVWKRTLFFSSKEIQSFPSNETIIDYYNYIQKYTGLCLINLAKLSITFLGLFSMLGVRFGHDLIEVNQKDNFVIEMNSTLCDESVFHKEDFLLSPNSEKRLG